jgi:DNA modification methylase
MKKITIGNCELYLGDCLEILPQLDIVADAIITDPPYGITNHSWDQPPALDQMWRLFESKTKQNANFVMFSCGGFTIDLINARRNWFRYDLCWAKSNRTGFLNSGLQPLRAHENILVFGRPGFQKAATYNPIKATTLPISVLAFDRDAKRPEQCLHPTMKPLRLTGYLPHLYSNENDLVIDPFMGSGTTGDAALRLNRRFIGIEREEKFFDIACRRIAEAHQRKFARYKPRISETVVSNELVATNELALEAAMHVEQQDLVQNIGAA